MKIKENQTIQEFFIEHEFETAQVLYNGEHINFIDYLVQKEQYATHHRILSLIRDIKSGPIYNISLTNYSNNNINTFTDIDIDFLFNKQIHLSIIDILVFFSIYILFLLNYRNINKIQDKPLIYKSNKISQSCENTFLVKRYNFRPRPIIISNYTNLESDSDSEYESEHDYDSDYK